MSLIKHRGKAYRARGFGGVTTKQVLAAMEKAAKANMQWYKMIPEREGAAFEMARRLACAIAGAQTFDGIHEGFFPHILKALNDVAAMHAEPWPTTTDDPICEAYNRTMLFYQEHHGPNGVSALVHLINTALNQNTASEQQRDSDPFRMQAVNAPTVLAAMRAQLAFRGVTDDEIDEFDPDEESESEGDTPLPPSDDMKALIAATVKHNRVRGAASSRAILKDIANVKVPRDVPSDLIGDALAALAVDDEESEPADADFG